MAATVHQSDPDTGELTPVRHEGVLEGLPGGAIVVPRGLLGERPGPRDGCLAPVRRNQGYASTSGLDEGEAKNLRLHVLMVDAQDHRVLGVSVCRPLVGNHDDRHPRVTGNAQRRRSDQEPGERAEPASPDDQGGLSLGPCDQADVVRADRHLLADHRFGVTARQVGGDGVQQPPSLHVVGLGTRQGDGEGAIVEDEQEVERPPTRGGFEGGPFDGCPVAAGAVNPDDHGLAGLGPGRKHRERLASLADLGHAGLHERRGQSDHTACPGSAERDSGTPARVLGPDGSPFRPSGAEVTANIVISAP